MFKCFDSARQAPVVILDAEWNGEQLEGLRTKGREGHLLCPQCREPVRVRAGLQKAWHFAHHALGACALQHESAELLQARSLLYAWLQTSLAGTGAAINLEEKIDDRLPRPVDCVVAYPGGPVIAFWLAEKGLRERDDFRSCFKNADLKLNVIFLAGMLRTMQNSDGMFYEPGTVNLTVTERDFMYPSVLMNDLYGLPGENLHYLDPDTGQVTTLRALNLMHEPGVFKAETVLTDPLDSLRLVRHRLLVHPSETAGIGPALEVQRLREERKRLEQERQKAEEARQEAARLKEEEERRKQEAQWREEAEKQRLADERRIRVIMPKPEEAPIPERAARDEATGYETRPPSLIENALECEECGTKTRDWVHAQPAMGRCLCRPCYEIREEERLRRIREEAPAPTPSAPPAPPLPSGAPTCLNCRVPMILRRGSRGPFYGCPNYPRCRFTAPVRISNQ